MSSQPLAIGTVTFPVIEPARLVAMLEPPALGMPVDAVLDTDTYNEIDDQFAVVHALLSPERIRLGAIYAAPFHNKRSSGAGDGMTRSYEEILRVLDRLGRSPDGLVHRGSDRFLEACDQPVASDAATDLVERAMRQPADRPLYVLTIGAPTNVSSAILAEPRIIERIVVVWLGGQPHDWASAREFNLKQDLHASRVLFDSGVPLVQIPCKNVAEHLRTSVPEAEAWLRGRGAIGDYLVDIFVVHHDDHFCWSKVIWDISTVAWLINPAWVPTHLVSSPILTDQVTWSRDAGRHFVRVAVGVSRDAVFRDLYTRIAPRINPRLDRARA